MKERTGSTVVKPLRASGRGPVRLFVVAIAIGFIAAACGENQPAGREAQEQAENEAEATAADDDAEREQRERRKERLAYERCKKAYGSLLDALEIVDVRLDEGMGFNEYEVLVSDAQVEYDSATRGSEPTSRCLDLVAAPAENALNSYLAASKIWKDCYEEECPGLQRHWGNASGQLAKAINGLATLEPVP